MSKTKTKSEKKEHLIYGLVSPRTKSIKKIGYTTSKKRRESSHKLTYPTLNMQVIGECESFDLMVMWEWMLIELWNPPLNKTPGGGSPPTFYGDDHPLRKNNQAKNNHRVAMKKLTQSKEWNDKILVANQCPERNKKISESVLALQSDKGYIKKRKTSLAKARQKPSYRKNLSDSRKKWCKENREEMMQAIEKTSKAKEKITIATNIKTGLSIEFVSSKDAAIKMSKKYNKTFYRGHISSVCNGVRTHHHGWKFEHIKKQYE